MIHPKMFDYIYLLTADLVVGQSPFFLSSNDLFGRWGAIK